MEAREDPISESRSPKNSCEAHQLVFAVCAPSHNVLLSESKLKLSRADTDHTLLGMKGWYGIRAMKGQEKSSLMT